MKFYKNPFFYFNLINGIIPLLGVLFLQWSVLDVFVLFILEILLLGFFTLIKMIFSKVQNGKKGSSIFLYCILYPVAFLFIFILLGNFFDARNRQMNSSFSKSSIYFLIGIYLFDLVYFYFIKGQFKIVSASKIMGNTFMRLLAIFGILLMILVPISKFVATGSQGILMGISILICRIIMDQFLNKKQANN